MAPNNNSGGFRSGRGGHRPHDPSIGSRLPEKMLQELEEQDQDERQFKKSNVNKAANRKEMRKQKRLDKGKRKALHHAQLTQSAKKRQKTQEEEHNKNGQQKIGGKKPTNQSSQSAKNKKTDETMATEKPIKVAVTPQKTPKQKEHKTKNDKEALDRLSQSNPQLFSLLEQDNLVNDTGKNKFEEDERDIAYWEKKLGMNKKKKAGYGKAFAEDGLLDLLDGLDGKTADSEQESEPADDDAAYLRKKRLAKTKGADQEANAEKAMDSLFGGFDESEGEMSEEEEVSEEEPESEDESDIDDDEEMIYDETSSIAEEEEEENEDEDEDEDEDDDDEEEEEDKDGEKEETPIQRKTQDITATPAATSTPSKYVPPHLRKVADTKTEQQIKLHRILQGLLNRLNESNIQSILMDIEKCYSTYPRHDVTSTITNIILVSISLRGSLQDSFVIPYAAIIGAVYRLIGVDFAAFFVQALVEDFERNYNNCQDSIARGEDMTEEGANGAKEAKNLLTLAIELYNFQVIACVLVYDIIHLLIKSLNEYAVDLLMKIVTAAGAQLRTDDPTSLKDIIDEIQKETQKRDASTVTLRHKFMLETLSNIKNNKIKNGPTASGQADKELVMKLKKFLSSLDKKRTTKSAEALRVSLEDIHNIETKGKWWLVGASWRDNLVGTESKHKKAGKIASDLQKEQSLQEALLKLARKQGMNTDVRRSIFVTVMSAEDYLDAFERLMKLGLTEVQQREIARVLVQCTGNEKTFNPFYLHVAKRFCSVSHSFKVTFQYCLWDFLRECGEREVGGLERTASESFDMGSGGDAKVRIGRILNVAKFYAALVAGDSLSLSILRSVNFMILGTKGRLWMELFFVHLFLQAKDGGAQAVATIFGKIMDMRTLAQGCLFFLQETVIRAPNAGLTPEEIEVVRSGCKIAKTVLSRR